MNRSCLAVLGGLVVLLAAVVLAYLKGRKDVWREEFKTYDANFIAFQFKEILDAHMAGGLKEFL